MHCGWHYKPAGVTAAQIEHPLRRRTHAARRCRDRGRIHGLAIGDPYAVELASRVVVVPDEGIDELGPMRRYTVHVEVETHGGETFHGTAADRPGSPALPLSDDELTAKFLGLAVPVVGDEAAARIAELVGSLENLGDTAELTALLSTSSPEQPS